MKLTVVAATGRIGREVVRQALEAGHDVTAVARTPGSLPASVRAVQCDLGAADAGALRSALEGADAVLSGLGPRSLKDAGIASRGTRAVLEAMTATGVRRIVVVSAAPISTVASPGRPHPPTRDPGEGFVTAHVLGPVIKRVFATVYADLAAMEDLLRDSGLDWTAVRPPRLTNRPLTGAYRLAYEQNLPGGGTVPRADVAHCMLHLLDDPDSVGHAVGVAT